MTRLWRSSGAYRGLPAALPTPACGMDGVNVSTNNYREVPVSVGQDHQADHTARAGVQNGAWRRSKRRRSLPPVL
ncbi:MAG: hypothetical protein ACLUE8_02520 [Lachnospiraceae bacterium]